MISPKRVKSNTDNAVSDGSPLIKPTEAASEQQAASAEMVSLPGVLDLNETKQQTPAAVAPVVAEAPQNVMSMCAQPSPIRAHSLTHSLALLAHSIDRIHKKRSRYFRIHVFSSCCARL